MGEGKEESDDEKAGESKEDPDPADASEAPDVAAEGSEGSQINNPDSEDTPTMDDALAAAETTEETEEGAKANSMNVKDAAKVIWQKAKALMESVPKSSLSHNDAKQLFDAIRSTLAKSIKIDTEKKAEAVEEKKKVAEATAKKDEQMAAVKAKYVQEVTDKARKKVEEEEVEKENQRITDHDKRIADKVVSVIRAAGYEHDTKPHPALVKHDKAELLLESELILKDLGDHLSTYGTTGHTWKGMWKEMHMSDSGQNSQDQDQWESRKIDWEINKAMDKFRAKGSEFTEALMKKIGVEASSCDESAATKCVKKCAPCLIECDILRRWSGDQCDRCVACTSCQPYLLCTGLRDSYKNSRDSGSSLFPTTKVLEPKEKSDDAPESAETKTEASALEKTVAKEKVIQSMPDGPQKEELLNKIDGDEAQEEAKKIQAEEAEKIIPSHHKAISKDKKSGKAPTVSEDENKKNKSALEQAAKDVTKDNEDVSKLKKLEKKKDADSVTESEASNDSVEQMNAKIDVQEDEKLIENAEAKVAEDDKKKAEANKDEGSENTKQAKPTKKGAEPGRTKEEADDEEKQQEKKTPRETAEKMPEKEEQKVPKEKEAEVGSNEAPSYRITY